MEYPTADEIHMLHNRIVVQNSNPESGIRNAAAIESALTYISSGHFGRAPELIHAKAITQIKREHTFAGWPPSAITITSVINKIR
jgi:hypothetical protein